MKRSHWGARSASGTRLRRHFRGAVATGDDTGIYAGSDFALPPDNGLGDLSRRVPCTRIRICYTFTVSNSNARP